MGILFAKMDIKVLEESKNHLIIEMGNVGHGFCNILVKELWNDKNTKSAGYHIEHPLIGKAKIVIESKADVRKVLNRAITRVKRSADDFKKAFVKIC